jgi:hypothetical protein
MWSEREVEEFNKRCHPDSIAKQRMIDHYFGKYGRWKNHNPHGSGPYLPTEYWVENLAGKPLMLRTPLYKFNIRISFGKYEDAKRIADKMGGKVGGTSYTDPDALDGNIVDLTETNYREIGLCLPPQNINTIDQ